MPIVSLPAAPAKTWAFTFNTAVATAGTALADHRANFLQLKNSLLTAPQATCRGSSNSVAAGMDGVDRLAAAANVVAASEGSGHSWIVIRLAGIGAAFEILFDFGVTATNAQLLNVILSATGFTGGSTANRPTAIGGVANEVYLLDGAAGVGWLNGSASGFSTRWNFHRTTDGSQVRFIAFQAGAPILFASFDALTAPRAGVTFPWAATWISGNTADRLTATITTSNSGPMNVRGLPCGKPARFGWVFGQTDGRPDPTTMTTNAISGERPVWSIPVRSLTHRSHVGTVGDLYQGSSAWTTVDGAPAAGPRVWQAYGTLLLPHDGTVGTPGGTALITT